jgi:hypothetical protein
MMDASPRLTLVRDLFDLDDTRHQHARAALRGEEHRVSRGAYVDAAVWAALNSRERYLIRVKAIVETRRVRPVLSHWTAVAVHGLPFMGDLPTEVHTIGGTAAGGRSRNGLVVHSIALNERDIVEVDGMLVTSIARTVLDIATVGSFVSAVVVADRALHVDRFRRREPLTSRTDLEMVWHDSLPFRGHMRAERVIDFAETRSDSPLESASRVTMHRIGCPRPLLQSRFSDAHGFIAESDFDWPEYGLLGEADGDVKYLDEAMRAGRTAEQVVLDEKIREDRLRALPRNVTRWRWSTAISPAALRAQLLGAGLPMGRPW